jgi:hypothetical protein
MPGVAVAALAATVTTATIVVALITGAGGGTREDRAFHVAHGGVLAYRTVRGTARAGARRLSATQARLVAARA